MQDPAAHYLKIHATVGEDSLRSLLLSCFFHCSSSPSLQPKPLQKQLERFVFVVVLIISVSCVVLLILSILLAFLALILE